MIKQINTGLVNEINTNDIKFKMLDRNDLDTLVNWATQEGWNPGPFDASVFWETDPEGFYGYYHQNELIAGGSIVSYDGNFGFMGFFIVKQGYRGLGIGRSLWKQRRDLLLTRLKEGACIGMDGVVAMQPFYRKGGFESAFRDERHSRLGEAFDIDLHISPVNDNDLEEIIDYDSRCFGVPRPRFLKPWLKMPGSRNFKFVADGTLKGFIHIRQAGTGYKTGPLFADNGDIAEALYVACLNEVPGEEVFLDIPVINPAAVQLVKKYKTSYVFECARMYYGKPPEQELEKIFGITTFELG